MLDQIKLKDLESVNRNRMFWSDNSKSELLEPFQNELTKHKLLEIKMLKDSVADNKNVTAAPVLPENEINGQNLSLNNEF